MLTGLTDAPAGIFMICIVVCSILYAKIGPQKTKTERFFLGSIITLVYMLSAMITSTCFSELDYYLASDPIRYIALVHRSNSFSQILEELKRAYIEFGDNNGLYNSILRLVGILCKYYGYKASSLLITLPQSLFGILTIQTLYRILNIKFSRYKSFKYALIYGICSLTLLYSGIIVRDIIIAFLFANCIEIVLKPFSVRGVFMLGIIMIICIGIRLFSGLFVSIFILYYVFFNVKTQFAKVLIYPIAIFAIIGVGGSAFADEMFTKTSDEIDSYSQWQNQTANTMDGFSGKLRKLPPGISNIALSLFSQMNPFPPYSTLQTPNLNPAQIYMSCLMTLSAVWWFFISYGLLWFFIIKKGYKRLGIRYNCLFAIAWLLIAVSSTMHVDIRRLIPVYPIIYFLFLYCINFLYSKKQVQDVYMKLGTCYLILNIIYLMMK